MATTMEGIMETLINGLIGQYETGALSRRELVGALAVLSVTANTAFAADAGFQSAGINHVSITASNLQRTVDFYARVFNLARQPGQNANLVQLQVGKDAHLSIREGGNPRFDHFAIGIQGFNKDRVIASLRARGAMPIDGGDGAGLHVADPDGLYVQVIGSGGAG
jgi:catechol 2,3-dioxygenase-like lactoylglutathione lyase family enzyme